MRNKFLQFINDHDLVKPGQKILLAVSGGADSMVMLDLFRESGFLIGVAHVNYQLRGADSEADQQCVEEYCKRWNIPCFVHRVNYSSRAGGNIQILAREARYTFFESTALDLGFDKIATAHHIDDALETFLLNSSRGSGLDGLDGIPIQRNTIIRPMLFANRESIIQYAEQHNVPFREDLSNQKNNYNRNKIRNQILPVLDTLHERKRTGFYHTLTYLRQDNELFHFLLQNYIESYWDFKEDYRVLDLLNIRKQPFSSALLFHVLKPFGFRREQSDSILSAKNIGARYQGTGWVAVVEKPGLCLYEEAVLKRRTGVEIVFHAFQSSVEHEGNTWSLQLCNPAAEKVGLPRLPVRIRPWKKDDVFYPVAMKGKSKDISKILSENQIPLLYRPLTLVMADDDQKIWAILPFQLSLFVGYDFCKNPFFDVVKNGQSVLCKT